MAVNNSNISKLFRGLVGLPERADMDPTTTIAPLCQRVVGIDDPEPEPEEQRVVGIDDPEPEPEEPPEG